MKITTIILLSALSLSLHADIPCKRGSILSSEGTVIVQSSIKNGSEIRSYPYGKLLSPVIGHTQVKKDKGAVRIEGVNGLELYYDEALIPTKSGVLRGEKSMDIKLNIPIKLQMKAEAIADLAKKEIDADEVQAFIMESRSGKLLCMASSNRYDPNNVSTNDYESLIIDAVSNPQEPGSLIKPIIFSLLLEKKRVRPTEIVDGHNGKYVIGSKTIVDEQKFKTLSAENVIVYSSNIGIAQLAQRLKGYEIAQGLDQFGFVHFSGIDFPYEKRGNLPGLTKLDNYLYKAIISYGYGLNANTMQMLSAYNVFNANGRLIPPKVANSIMGSDGKSIPVEHKGPIQVISSDTASQMKKILIKTVTHGTGKIAQTPGLEVGGKTGTVFIAKDEKHAEVYNSSFFGFANDANQAYTIGVIVKNPRAEYSSSSTAVPVFKKLVDVMVKEKYLRPKIRG